MLMEASGDIVVKVGDTFVVHMDREALNDYPLGLYDVRLAVSSITPATSSFQPGRPRRANIPAPVYHSSYSPARRS